MPETDFGDIYASVIKYSTILLVPEIVALRHLHILQIYYRYTFINGDLEEEVYGAQLRGFEHAGSEEKVFALSKGSVCTFSGSVTTELLYISVTSRLPGWDV